MSVLEQFHHKFHIDIYTSFFIISYHQSTSALFQNCGLEEMKQNFLLSHLCECCGFCESAGS